LISQKQLGRPLPSDRTLIPNRAFARGISSSKSCPGETISIAKARLGFFLFVIDVGFDRSGPEVRFGSKGDIPELLSEVCFPPERWGNRPAQVVDS
jgi:hypothetical protein